MLHPKARPFGMVDGYSNFLFRSERRGGRGMSYDRQIAFDILIEQIMNIACVCKIGWSRWIQSPACAGLPCLHSFLINEQLS